MPRFYFDVIQGEESVEDDEGTELPSIEAAERDALISAAEINRDNAKAGRINTVKVQVRDEGGKIVLTAASVLKSGRPELNPIH